MVRRSSSETGHGGRSESSIQVPRLRRIFMGCLRILLAMEGPSEQTVLGDFSGTELAYDGITSRLIPPQREVASALPGDRSESAGP